MRVFDLLLKIYLSLFFVLVPFYNTNNTEYDAIVTERNIDNMNIGRDDLAVKFKQVRIILIIYRYWIL